MNFRITSKNIFAVEVDGTVSLPSILAEPKAFFPPNRNHSRVGPEVFIRPCEIFEVSEVLVALLDARSQDLFIGLHVIVCIHVAKIRKNALVRAKDVSLLEDWESQTLSLISIVKLYGLHVRHFC